MVTLKLNIVLVAKIGKRISLLSELAIQSIQSNRSSVLRIVLKLYANPTFAFQDNKLPRR